MAMKKSASQQVESASRLIDARIPAKDDRPSACCTPPPASKPIDSATTAAEFTLRRCPHRLLRSQGPLCAGGPGTRAVAVSPKLWGLSCIGLVNRCDSAGRPLQSLIELFCRDRLPLGQRARAISDANRGRQRTDHLLVDDLEIRKILRRRGASFEPDDLILIDEPPVVMRQKRESAARVLCHEDRPELAIKGDMESSCALRLVL